MPLVSVQDATVWHGCYDDSWKGLIVDDAFAHPAKYAHGLITRIADYLDLSPLSVVVDPFGGVGLGGIIFASRGVRWIGCELEAKFVGLAEQNFAKHAALWHVSGDPFPRIVQGDSRQLRQHVGPVLADCVVGSPPYTGDDPRAQGTGTRKGGMLASKDTSGRFQGQYGSTPGQLGGMPAGSVDAVVGSPPFTERQPTANARPGEETPLQQMPVDTYGNSPGQLGGMPAGSVDAVVGSPPFSSGDSGSAASMERRSDASAAWVKANCGSAATKGYGSTPGQLGGMPAGSVEAIVSSPPYEGSETGKPSGTGEWRVEQKKKALAEAGYSAKEIDGFFTPGRLRSSNLGQQEHYGETAGQLGIETGETFWTAARDIVAECHAILRPGGLAVWVCKDFVRKGQRVPFSRDWAMLCESQGFQLVEWIHASLVKETRNRGLFEDEVAERKERKSFFRRLAEKKGSPPIDHEDVLVMRCP